MMPIPLAVALRVSRSETFAVDLGFVMPRPRARGGRRVELVVRGHGHGQKLLQCRKCGRWMAPGEFHLLTNPKSLNGHSSECVRCTSRARSARREHFDQRQPQPQEVRS